MRQAEWFLASLTSQPWLTSQDYMALFPTRQNLKSYKEISMLAKTTLMNIKDLQFNEVTESIPKITILRAVQYEQNVIISINLQSPSDTLYGRIIIRSNMLQVFFFGHK